MRYFISTTRQWTHSSRNAAISAAISTTISTVALFGLVGAAPLETPAPATSQPAPINLAYEFYAAGFQLASMQATARFTDDSYSISSSGKSSGLAETIARARFESEATGSLGRAGPRPHRFRNFSDTRFGVRSLEMIRDGNGTFDVTAEPELEPQQAAALRSGLADGTLDPLTAILYSSLRPAAAVCTEKLRVFDGRRVFNLDFKRKGAEVLTPGTEGVFAGDTVKCELNYVPLAGQSREWKLEQARNPTPPVELWMAPFRRDGTNADVMIPVRMQLESEWGTAVIHLVSVEAGGHALMQASLTPAQ